MATLDLSSVDDSTKLCEDDLRDIMSEISGLHAEFYNLGIELGIKAGDLNGIKLDSSLNAQGKLNNVILQWLNEKYTVEKFGKPTWRRLVEAVSKVNPAKAKEIVCNLKGCAAGKTESSFSLGMSIDDFILFLKNEGLEDEEDCSKLKKHGIGAKVFIKMTEEEICDPELGFTFGGKKTLKGVWKMIKEQEAKHPPNITKKPPSNGCASINTPQPGPYRKLDDNDHSVIYQNLCPNADQWKDLGTALGFSDNELEQIQKTPLLLLDGNKGYLRKMLSNWLQWGPGDGRRSSDFANSVDLCKALLKINLAPIAYKLDSLLHEQ